MDGSPCPNLRSHLQKLLNVRCIFPCGLSSDGNSARCMLEVDGDNTIPYEDATEDVIVKYFSNEYYREGIKYCISKLFSKVPTFRESSVDQAFRLVLESRQQTTVLHPGIAPLLKFYDLDCGSILVQAYAKHSILSLSRFHAKTTLTSPTLGRAAGMGSRDLRLRFIIFQLLQVLDFIHEQGLYVGSLAPSNVMLDDAMWLTLPVGISEDTVNCAMSQISPNISAELSLPSGILENRPVPIPVDHYEPITVQWAKGKISNFEYLMAVNFAAGRFMADPLYHPILPWVTDFTQNLLPCNYTSHIASYSCLLCNADSDVTCKHTSAENVRLKSLRDLTKTKFRLSKGDHQLETTFRHSDPSHHVPESLSELTYYIYMARRTPMQVLRRVVRDVFVPEHYPSSMARMFEWSPDECIPEFYCDSSVFASIHKEMYGLSDLDLPSFAPSPTQFISYHRGVLESDEVSAQLHYWLDLTFGYCLDGEAAIENMNVPLRHTLSSAERTGDSPKLDKHPGFVMLFNKPHPKRHTMNVVIDMESGSHNPILPPCSGSVQQASASNSHNPDGNVRGIFLDPSNCTWDLLDYPRSTEEIKMNLEKSLQQLVDIGSGFSSSTRQRGLNSTSRYLTAAGNSFNAVLASNSSVSSGLDRQSSLASSPGESLLAGSLAQKSNLSPASVTIGAVDNRKSLTRPLADSTLLYLQSAGSIDIDQSCNISVPSMNARADEMKFSSEFRNILEPAYTLQCDCCPLSIDDVGIAAQASIWDDDLLEAIENFERTGYYSVEDKIKQMQAEDMFSVGCIIAELFCGKPLISNRDAINIKAAFIERKDSRDHIRRVIRTVYRETSSLPLSIRRIVSILLQPNPQCRPAAKDILHACCAADIESWDDEDFERQCVGGPDAGCMDFSQFRGQAKLQQTTSSDKFMINGSMVELLSDYCSGLFPPYFKPVYSIIGRIRLCRKDSNRMKIIVDSLDELASLPLEGLTLALPHLLAVLADPRPFRSHSSANPGSSTSDIPATPSGHKHQRDSDNGQIASDIETPGASLREKEDKQLENLLREYATIVDVLGLRLGLDSSEKLLVPPILNFLNKLTSTTSLQILLDSSLWSVIILRTGVCCFLRQFLPSLLTYVVAGTLQRVSQANLQLDSGSPMWSNIAGAEQYDWLHECHPSEVRSVQMAAVASVINLSDPSALGHGLCARYIMPALLCLISVPQLSAAGYGLNTAHHNMIEFKKLCGRADNEDILTDRRLLTTIDRPDTYSDDSRESGAEKTLPQITFQITSREDVQNLDSFISSKAQYDPQDMFTVRGIVGLCVILGELVTAEVVISKIFNSILPDLQKHMTTPLSAPITAAIMEAVLLLNGVLPTLSPNVIIKSLLMPAKSSGLSLPKLLNMIPLSPCWSVLDDLSTSITSTNLEAYIDYQRNHILHLELCRLVVSSSMIAGPAACEEYVLSSLDLFFSNFVETFGMISIETKTMSRAFELGSELFLPLAQLVGPEAFYTTVSNLNPRLEMWLLSVGSGGVRTSPPLPPNILPEVVQTNSGVDKGKKKGLFQSLKSGFKSTFSISSSNAPNNVAAGSVNNKLSQGPSKVAGRSASVDSFGESRARALNFTPGGGKQFVATDAKTGAATQTHSTIYEPHNLTDDFVGFGPPSDGKQQLVTSPKPPGTELVAMSAQKTPFAETRSVSRDDGSFLASHHASSPQQDFDSDDDFDDESSNDIIRVRMDGNHGQTQEHQSHSKDDEEDGHQRQLQSRGNATSKSVDFGITVDSDVVSSDHALSVQVGTESQDDFGLRLPHSHGEESDDGNDDFESRRAFSSDSFTDRSDAIALRFQLPSHSYKKLLSGGTSSSHLISKKKERRPTKMTSILSGKPATSVAEEEEEEAREIGHNDHTWLLAGKGRWNIAREVRAKKTKELRETVSRGGPDSANASKRLAALTDSFVLDNNWAPAAQVSMTAPKIAVDVASEAVSLFAFGMTCRTQWRAEDGPHPIKMMVVDDAETLLLTSGKSGVKVFALNTHPLKQVGQYQGHATAPFCAAFMRSGLHVASCDGAIKIWDIETSKTLAGIDPHIERGQFSFMDSILPKVGVTPTLQCYGDNQLIACQGSALLHFDLRLRSRHVLKPVSEWILPPLPVAYSNFSSNASLPVHLTCAASQEKLLMAGSSSGGLWVMDRRMGKVLNCWQAHEGPVVKISALDDRCFLSIADKSAYVWGCADDAWNAVFGNESLHSLWASSTVHSGDVSHSNFEMQKLLTVRNTPDGNVPISSSTTLLHTFEQSNSSYGMDIGIPTKPLNVLYCVCGHKMYAGRIPSPDVPKVSIANREISESEEIKLSQTYFCDRNKAKLPKQKLTVSSAVMLPLRRLLLLGTEDGLVRVIS